MPEGEPVIEEIGTVVNPSVIKKSFSVLQSAQVDSLAELCGHNDIDNCEIRTAIFWFYHREPSDLFDRPGVDHVSYSLSRASANRHYSAGHPNWSRVSSRRFPHLIEVQQHSIVLGVKHLERRHADRGAGAIKHVA